MKLKIAGLFRSLLGKGENVQQEPTSASGRPIAKPSANPANPQSNQASDSPNIYASPQDSTAPSTTPDPEHPDEIGIPLLAIANSLPMDLKAKLIGTPAPGRMVYFPLENVISQLAFGAVKISFGELRNLVPGIFVNGLNSTFDNRPVTLPLNEILARINPALLARRPAAQKIEVAEEIAGPFAGHGRGISFTDQPLKGSPVPTPPPTRTVKPELPGIPKRDIKPALPSLPSRDHKPVPPINLAPPSPFVTPPIPFAEPLKPDKSGNANGRGNGKSNGNGHGTGNGAAQSDKNKGNASPTLPPFRFNTTTPAAASVPPSAAPISMAAPAPKPAPKPLVGVQPAVSVWLQELSEKWPDEIKLEIVSQGLGNAKVPLPLRAVEPGLKRGRVTMAWREIRSFINPNSPLSSVDDLELDLPLQVVAPAFLAAQRKLSAQTSARVAVSEEIPNLFFGFPQPETSAPATPPPSTPAAPDFPAPSSPPPVFRPTPLPRMTPASSETSSLTAPVSPLKNSPTDGDTNIFPAPGNSLAQTGDSGFIQRTPSPPTDFLSRQMQPKDVVAHALALPGVAGAVVALADGLRVAGQVPPEFNADTVAAFLPQIYERVNQCTRELRMGALNNVSFTVGNVPWKIFRVNSIYFATFGRADETFPKAELAQLASGLNRKSK